MAISYSGEGYKFNPQFANLGALQGLQPLDVTRKAEFQLQPLTYAPIPSSRPELVSEGISKGILAAVGGITEGITAKYKAEQKREEKLAERAHEKQLVALKYGLDKTETEEKAKDYITRQKALIDYRNDTAKRLKGSLGENFPIYGGDTTTETETEPAPIEVEPIEDELPADFDTTLNELEGTSLFGQLAPADAMQAQIAEQAKQLQGLSPEYLTAGLEAGAVAPIEPVPQMSLEGFKATAISPEQAAQATEVRKELRQTLAGIKPVKPEVAKSEAQRPGWYPIEKAQEEASRNIPGWKPAEIDEVNVKNVGGVPYYLVKPRKVLTKKEQAEEQAALKAPEMSKEQNAILISQIGKLEADKTYFKALESRDSRDIILTSLSKEDGFSDIAAINAFQRLIDPGVAVREGDVALIQSASALFDKYNPKFIGKKFQSGDKLPPEDREKMRSLTKELARMQMEKANKGPIQKYRSLTQKTGIDPDLLAVPFDLEETKEQTPQDQISTLSMELEQVPVDQRNSPDFLAKRKVLFDLVKQQEELKKKSQPKPTPTPTQVPQPTFQPAVPRQPVTEYGETIESMFGNR